MHLNEQESQPVRRRRGETLRSAILSAAWEELLARGYDGFRLSEVARRAGTSRPGLNRHWDKKTGLVRDAIRYASDRFLLVDPDTGTLREDIIGLMVQLNESFAMFAASLTAELSAYYGATGTSPAQLRLGLVEKRWSIIEGVLSRAVERGEIDPDRLTERTARLPFDLLRHETLMTLKPLPRENIAAIVDQIFLPLVLPSTA
jgi:AcrR family transcriptional regulator